MTSVYDNVLITGGGGMLAQALARTLKLRGVQPTILTRAQLDITAPFVAATQIHGASVVINCAAFTKVDACEAEFETAANVNALAPAALAAQAQRLSATFVHFSTDFVFDGSSREPYKPKDPTNPLSAYGQSKERGEHFIHKLNPDALIIRTSWLYGPGGPNFVQTMLKVARAGKPLNVVNDQIGSPTFTHDLADATLALIDAGARGIYHATNSGQTTWFDFARAIFEEFDVKADLSPTTSADWKAQYPNSAPRPAYSVLDCSETERVIGRPMPDWRDGLRRYREVVEPRRS